MKHNNPSDYTRLQLKAFLRLLAVSVSMAVAFAAIVLLRARGLGGNVLLYWGVILLLALMLLLLLLFFSRQSVKPFRELDSQLDELLQDESFQPQLRGGPPSTEQRLLALQEALKKRSLREQLAEQQKNDLVMYLAHDIRTPLTSVIGYLSLLDEAVDMPEVQRKKYTHITLEKACKLERMTNEFFEIARYSLQQIQLNRESVDLCYMLIQLTDELLPVLAKNGNTSVIQMESEDIAVYADREKLARVFSNILKNAAAYSYPGTEILIQAAERDGMAKIAFCNQGETIPPQMLEKLFDKFYRMDEARSADSGGTGLGLAIAREIVTLHGGTIRVESENSTVTVQVTLPIFKRTN